MLIPFARRHLRTVLRTLPMPPADLPAPESFLLTRRYTGNSAVFLRRGGEPFLVYKLAAAESLNWLLDNAVECEQEARRHGFRTQTVCATGRLRGRAFAVYSWLSGAPFYGLEGGAPDHKSMLARATEAITELHLRTLRAAPDLSGVERRAGWWRDLLFAHPALPADSRRTIDRVLSLLADCAGKLPGILMHGDSAGNNLLQDAKGKVAFIDWELGLVAGLPGIDLVTFLVHHLPFSAGNGGYGGTFARCFLEPGPVADKCREVVDAYAARLGLPREVLPVLVATTLLKIVAESRHYAVLHHGRWYRGRTADDLQVLDRLLTTADEALPSDGEIDMSVDSTSGLSRSSLDARQDARREAVSFVRY